MTHKRNLVLGTAAAFMGGLALRLSVPAVAFYSRAVLEASATLIGCLMAVYFAARAPIAAVTGRIYHHEVSVRLVPLCFIGSAAITVLYGVMSTIIGVLVLRALQGALLGYAWTVVQVIVGASSSVDTRGTLYAIYFAAGFSAMPVANVVYALLANYPVMVPLAVSAAAFTVTAAVTAFMEHVEAPKHEKAAKRVTSHRALILLLAMFILAYRLGSAFTATDIVYVYLSEVYRISRSATALLLAAASAVGVAVSIPINALADKVSDRLPIIIVGAAEALGLLLFASSSLLLACIGIVLLMAGARSVTPLSRRIALTYAESEGVGYVNAAGSLGVVLSSLMLGAAYDLAVSASEGAFKIMLTVAAVLAAMIIALSIALALMLPSSPVTE